MMANSIDPVDQIVVFDRDQIAANYRRSRLIRNPAADVGPGTEPYLDSLTFADAAVVLYGDALLAGEATNLRSTFGKRLEAVAASEGLTRLPAIGASGYVLLVASVGGAVVLAGAVLTDAASGLRYRVAVSGTYSNGGAVPVVGIDTGPGSNVAAGTVLAWKNPPSGAGPVAPVAAQTDGSGLSGGADIETDADLQRRIAYKRANPPSAGNDAAYQALVLSLPNVAVQAAFTYPAIKGPGTCGVTFTIRPAVPGGPRLPNSTQLTLAQVALTATFPADDGIFLAALTAQNVLPMLRVQWTSGAAGWADATPWPVYLGAGNQIKVSESLTALSCYVSTASTTTDPQAGQTLGFFDLATMKWKKKRIATVAVINANWKWALTFDAATSDTSYVPQFLDVASPWSDSLDAITPAIAGYFDGIGPGEQVAVFPDPGMRQRRQPQSSSAWQNTVSNRLLAPLFALPSVADATLLEPTVPYATTVGTPGTLSYLLTFSGLAVFPL